MEKFNAREFLENLFIDEVERKVAREILAERGRSVRLAHGGDTEAFDRGNTRNDWVSYVTAYTGRAADKVSRNEREGQMFRENMIKAAALCLSAVINHDKGYC